MIHRLPIDCTITINNNYNILTIISLIKKCIKNFMKDRQSREQFVINDTILRVSLN